MKKSFIFLCLLSFSACLIDEPLIPVGATNNQAPILNDFMIFEDSLTAQITEDGIGGVQRHGFVYATDNIMPTLENTSINLGSLLPITQPHTFTTKLTGLQIGATYYVRAFVQNKYYTIYSENSQVITVADPFEPQMITIPAGTFQMGDSTMPSSQPTHTVTLSSFKIGQYEVTQKQWRAVMGVNPSHFANCDNCPVELVSWNDIQIFLQTLNAATGKNYRLPTEAEWEYAARAGQNYVYSGSNNIEDVAWYRLNTDKTQMVGQKLPNAYGLYDMSGNVWEWCNDWFSSYESAAATNPTGPSTGSYRVVRGGSWYYYGGLSLLAFRSDSPPNLRYVDFGFRLAL